MLRIGTALTTALIFAFAASPAAATENVPLHRVAAKAGYDYQWSTSASALVLSRPGMVVVLRPGSSVYQVNDIVEVADAPPRFSAGDLYVSSTLATHLEGLARHARVAVASSSGTSSVADSSVQGAITLEAHQSDGAESLDVTGTAPAGALVTSTLLALVSPDVPTILVSRHDVVTDVNGRFGAVIPIASAFERGTELKIVATSASGVTSAQTQVLTGAPNPGVSVPLGSH